MSTVQYYTLGMIYHLNLKVIVISLTSFNIWLRETEQSGGQQIRNFATLVWKCRVAGDVLDKRKNEQNKGVG
jgi:hypothetical protein